MDRIEQKELDIIDIKNLTKFQKRQVVSLVEKFNEDNKETTADSFHVWLHHEKGGLNSTFYDYSLRNTELAARNVYMPEDILWRAC